MNAKEMLEQYRKAHGTCLYLEDQAEEMGATARQWGRGRDNNPFTGTRDVALRDRWYKGWDDLNQQFHDEIDREIEEEMQNL